MKTISAFAIASTLAVFTLATASAQTSPTPQVNPATTQGAQPTPPGGTATTAPSGGASRSAATDNTSMMGAEPMSPCPQGAASPNAANNASGTPEGCKKM